MLLKWSKKNTVIPAVASFHKASSKESCRCLMKLASFDMTSHDACWHSLNFSLKDFNSVKWTSFLSVWDSAWKGTLLCLLVFVLRETKQNRFLCLLLWYLSMKSTSGAFRQWPPRCCDQTLLETVGRVRQNNVPHALKIVQSRDYKDLLQRSEI